MFPDAAVQVAERDNHALQCGHFQLRELGGHTAVLRQWLQACYVENRTLFPTAAGLRSGLSRVRGKLSCTVLTGGGGGNVASLPDQCLETKAKFIAQVTGESDLRRIEDIDGAALTYAEVKAKRPPKSMPTNQRNRRQLLPNLIL